MSKLGKILCLVLFASVANTFNLNFFESKRTSTDSIISSSVDRIYSQYDDASEKYEKILRNIQLKEPLNSGLPKNSCYRYLEKRLNTSKPIVDKCTNIQYQLAVNITNDIEKFVDKAVDELHSYRPSARERNGFRLNINWSTGKNKKKAWKLPNETRPIFSSTIEDIKRLLDDYVSDVGRCVATEEKPSTIGEWRTACGKSRTNKKSYLRKFEKFPWWKK